MTPNALAKRYTGYLVRHYTAYRRYVTAHYNDSNPPEHFRHLAMAALWLTAREHPDHPVPELLRLAGRLYNQWVVEDYRGLINTVRFEAKNAVVLDADRPKLDGYRYTPVDQKCELESDVFHCLDTVLRDCGVHLGLWLILGVVLADPKHRAQTMYRIMHVQQGSSSTMREQTERAARRTYLKLKGLLDAKTTVDV